MNWKELIVYEDDDLIALNKPSGLLSIPDREGKEISLKVLLLEKLGSIYTVHRLDRDTSGIIVFAKHEAAHKNLSQQFELRQTRKLYVGLVIGTPNPSSGSIDSPIAEHPAKNGTMIIHRKGKESLTDYELKESFGLFSWMEFQIHTGRTHQIRVHMKELGHPIVCDPVYGDGKPVLLSSFKSKFKLSKNEEEERPLLSRLALHSHELGIQSLKGEKLELFAEVPKDMRATLQQLGKRMKKR